MSYDMTIPNRTKGNSNMILTAKNPLVDEHGVLRDNPPRKRRLQVDVFLVLGVICLSVTVRFFTSTLVECWWDPLYYWQMTKTLVETGSWPADLPLTHHALRWAVNGPLLLLQFLFGTKPVNYYFFPFLCATGGAVVIWLVLRLLTSRTAASLGSIAFILQPQMVRDGSQCYPSSPQTVFLILALLLLLLWQRRSRLWLAALIGFCLFLSYGAKETSILWVPLFAALLIYARETTTLDTLRHCKRYSPAALMLLTFAIFYTIEHVTIYAFSGQPLGRLGISMTAVKSAYDGVTGWSESYSLLQWIASFYYRLRDFENPNEVTLHLGFAGALILMIAANSRTERIPAIGFLYGYAVHVYGVIGVFPFRYAERAQDRYFIPLFALAIIVILTLMFSIARRFSEGTRSWIRIVYKTAPGVLAVILCGYFAVATFGKTPRWNYFGDWPGIVRVHSYTKLLQEAREKDLPVIFVTGDFGMKTDSELKERVNAGNMITAKYSMLRMLNVVFHSPERFLPKVKPFPPFVGTFPGDENRFYTVFENNGNKGKYKGKMLLFTQNGNRSIRVKWDTSNREITLPH